LIIILLEIQLNAILSTLVVKIKKLNDCLQTYWVAEDITLCKYVNKGQSYVESIDNLVFAGFQRGFLCLEESGGEGGRLLGAGDAGSSFPG
jgi:hypothetical protein